MIPSCKVATRRNTPWLQYVSTKAKYISLDGANVYFVLTSPIPSDMSHPLTLQPSLFGDSCTFIYKCNRDIILREWIGHSAKYGCKIYNSKQELCYDNNLIF